MPRIMRKFEFDAGHRVVGHEGKCANLHGHRYVAEVYFQSEKLDKIGRVIDFGELKKVVGGWIDSNWDHNMLLNEDDPIMSLCETDRNAIFGKKDPYIFIGNPTAENISEELFARLKEIINDKYVDVKVTDVRVWETPNCCAEYPE